jgi:hypothetical protein
MTAQQKQQQQIDQIEGRTRELHNAKQEAERAVLDAETALATAYDDGEGLEIAKAQRKLSEAVAKVERRDADLESWKAQVKAAEAKAKAAPPKAGGDLDDTNLRDWKTKHSTWYGVDAEMTKASHEIDRQIRAAGVLSVGSKEYFEAIDRSLSQKYPDKFGGTPQGMTGSQQQQNTATKGRINRSIADGYRRMGINIDDPKTAERMLKHRETAVQKGILPQQPIQGSIIQR